MSIQPSRTAALALADAAVLLGLQPRWAVVAAGVVRPRAWLDSAGVDVALAALCGVVLWLAAAWVAVGLVAGLGTRLPGGAGRACARLARVVVPRVLLRVVLGSTGLGLLAAPAAHAMAPGPAHVSSAQPAAAFVSLWTGTEVPSPTWPATPSSTPTQLPAPAPPTSGTSAPRTPAPRAPAPSPTTGATRTQVHRGDSLWLLAANRLGPHAAAGDVAHYWPQIYSANRSVIGDDPSVIHPGQDLDLPSPTQESSR